MKLARLYPLLLTALLQVMPLARVVLTDQLPAAPGASILFKWAAGAFALVGFHGVAGATNVMVSPSAASGTNGVFFRYRILMSLGFSASFSASPLPQGIAVNSSSGVISGTPSFIGSMDTTITVSDPTGQHGSYVTTLTLNFLESPPSFTQQPASRTNFVGGTVSFTAAATGGSLFLWRYSPPGSTNLTDLITATNATFVLTNITTNHAGTYRVLAYSGSGEITSSPVTLTVVARPALQTFGISGPNLQMSLPVVPNLAYALESATNATGPWTLLTNLPPVAAATNLTVPDGITTNTARFYRVLSP